jgi:molecular chaperone HtpG
MEVNWLFYAGTRDCFSTARQLRKDARVVLLDSPIISRLIQKIEGDNSDITFVRVDSDHIDN